VQDIPHDARALIEQYVQRYASGKIDRATARCDLGVALKGAGHGDFADFDWLDVVLTLNFTLRSYWRDYAHDLEHPVLLDHWPAQEFLKVGYGQERIDWPTRWRAAAGRMFGNRMIALKDDSVWYRMSDFGYPFPPFVAASHMGLRAIDRREAMSLGLIDLDRRVYPPSVPKPDLLLKFDVPEET
jgi:hypothetical protein